MPPIPFSGQALQPGGQSRHKLGGGSAVDHPVVGGDGHAHGLADHDLAILHHGLFGHLGHRQDRALRRGNDGVEKVHIKDTQIADGKYAAGHLLHGIQALGGAGLDLLHAGVYLLQALFVHIADDGDQQAAGRIHRDADMDILVNDQMVLRPAGADHREVGQRIRHGLGQNGGVGGLEAQRLAVGDHRLAVDLRLHGELGDLPAADHLLAHGLAHRRQFLLNISHRLPPTRSSW